MPPPPDEAFEPRTRSIRSRRRPPTEPDEPTPQQAAESIDIEDGFPGSVFMVPDREWGFHAEDRIEHPGLCVHVDVHSHSTIFLQGRGASGLNSLHGYYVIDPIEGSGLRSAAAFRLRPNPIRLHRARRLYPDQHLGVIPPGELAYIRQELEHIFPPE